MPPASLMDCRFSAHGMATGAQEGLVIIRYRFKNGFFAGILDDIDKSFHRRNGDVPPEPCY